MIVKAGFDSKPLHIRINAQEHSRNAELWIEQEGLMVPLVSPKTKEIYTHRHSETLAYVSLDELLDLQKEIHKAILDIIEKDRVL